MRLALLLFAAPIASLLWRSGDHLPNGAVWKISAVICSYVFNWIFPLSETTIASILFIAAMVVITNDHLSPIAGTAHIQVDTISPPGFSGAPSPKAANGMASSNPLPPPPSFMITATSRKSSSVLERLTASCLSFAQRLLHGLHCESGLHGVQLRCRKRRVDTGDALLELSMWVGATLFAWAHFVVVDLLRGALVSEESMCLLLPNGIMVLFVVGFMVANLFGMATGFTF
ncbi:hypothetical protein E2562_001895 [Oryza meyeriana var. granulata]|uniref:Uncharacterized protein n=1 Tax=Oryza meyeriana var. granulata TaxID=110450 RepID=A0A6G1C1R3_9ORYZ|nr:hypothetical protein E2562_001895 [Oryza meyeriana var. granulata]